MKRLAALTLAMVLALLSACAPPAQAPSAFPSPDSEPSAPVAAHWDVLDSGRNAPLIRRWYPDYTGGLIPAPDYGPLIPYIGSENVDLPNGVQLPRSRTFLYGLATQEGVIVTDPVFLQVHQCSYYPADRRAPQPPLFLPILCLYQPSQSSPNQEVLSLAAADGSWCTPARYIKTICPSPLGVLAVEADGSMTMVGLDGEELFHWTAQQSPFYDPSLPLMLEALRFTQLSTDGDYAAATLPEGERIYIDLTTGQYSGQQPSGLFQASAEPAGPTLCPGGRWEMDEQQLTVYPDGGQPHSIRLPQADHISAFVDYDRIILNASGAVRPHRLLDLNGTELFTSSKGMLYFLGDGAHPNSPGLILYSSLGGSSAPVSVSDRTRASLSVLDRDGCILLSGLVHVQQEGDRLIYVDDGWYCLSTLDGTELLRIPRLDA